MVFYHPPDIDSLAYHYQTVEIRFEGEYAREQGGSFNPFTDRRFVVHFEQPDGTWEAYPGFFDADGNSRITNADDGNIWTVKYLPDQIGRHFYAVEYQKGSGSSVDPFSAEGSAGYIDRMTGTFQVIPWPETVDQPQGILTLQGNNLVWSETGHNYHMLQANSPENRLRWMDLNRVSQFRDMGVNSLYSTLFGGDDQDVHPYNTQGLNYSQNGNFYRFDCSLLDKWEHYLTISIQHYGMVKELLLAEMENDTWQDNYERRLFIREMTARFSSIPGRRGGIIWMDSEEPRRDDSRIRTSLSYIHEFDPNNWPRSIHNQVHILDQAVRVAYDPQTGLRLLEVASIQLTPDQITNADWIQRARNSGLAVILSEYANADVGIPPDWQNGPYVFVNEWLLPGYQRGAIGGSAYWGYSIRGPQGEICNDLYCEDILFYDYTLRAGADFTRLYFEGAPFSLIHLLGVPINTPPPLDISDILE